MFKRVGRVRPERDGRIGERVGDLAVELRVVDLAVRRIVERIVVLAEALALRERLFLVHLGPQHRIGAGAFGLDGGDELLHRALELRGVDDERQQPEAVLALLGVDRHVLDERMPLESLIQEFRLEKVRKSYGIQLSGGERRRCEIARALAIDPKFILLDEPFAGVDPIAVEDIQHIIAKLKTKNIGIIITDHNVHETLAITDRAYLLYDGSILESGTPEQLANNPEVRKRYLGQNFELRKAVLRKRDEDEY